MAESLHCIAKVRPLSGANFGAAISFPTADIESILQLCEDNAEELLNEFYRARGLMVVRGLSGIREQPGALVRLSKLFGPEVENYHQTLTSPRFFHESEEQILILSNAPPCNHPPPSRAAGRDGRLPIQFPSQRNWHTDQSYRRPPPDVTLLYAVKTPPINQGQTLFADCVAAFQSLDKPTQARLHGLQGIHAPSWVGRSLAAVQGGEKPIDLLPHQLPQKHPLLRKHPVTGETALFICEENQMDFVDGPIDGLSTGPNGEGAELLRNLLTHTTQEQFVHVHEWADGDLLIGDNRNLLHCATWYDADRYTRLMWRTTVMGNPGDDYADEAKSWLPSDGSALMQGMEHA